MARLEAIGNAAKPVVEEVVSSLEKDNTSQLANVPKVPEETTTIPSISCEPHTTSIIVQKTQDIVAIAESKHDSAIGSPSTSLALVPTKPQDIIHHTNTINDINIQTHTSQLQHFIETNLWMKCLFSPKGQQAFMLASNVQDAMQLVVRANMDIVKHDTRGCHCSHIPSRISLPDKHTPIQTIINQAGLGNFTYIVMCMARHYQEPSLSATYIQKILSQALIIPCSQPTTTTTTTPFTHDNQIQVVILLLLSLGADRYAYECESIIAASRSTNLKALQILFPQKHDDDEDPIDVIRLLIAQGGKATLESIEYERFEIVHYLLDQFPVCLDGVDPTSWNHDQRRYDILVRWEFDDVDSYHGLKFRGLYDDDELWGEMVRRYRNANLDAITSSEN
ncbi:hypothetical protein HDU76_005178 [Blyttiomyces sp. JEL0837]|nr:hypothetical protein HDU76_005178 [Blyttiomyces sp. JEL0837]